LEALLSSTVAVAVAEIGDKTQLLSLFLVSRFSNRPAIVAGIAVSTLLNHALSAWLGALVAAQLPPGWLHWIVGLSFIAIGAWVLLPDRDGDNESAVLQRGAFIAAAVLFFVAEMGDKTQIATVVLAAKYHDTLSVVAGTTLGMLLANVPVIIAGGWLLQKIPLHWVRRGAFVLFVGLGVLTLLTLH
jgi:putative Ca2+/H+ antiporter (TMEM165/GDT1 family)